MHCAALFAVFYSQADSLLALSTDSSYTPLTTLSRPLAEAIRVSHATKVRGGPVSSNPWSMTERKAFK